MKNKIIEMLKKNKLPRDIKEELGLSINPSYKTDYYYLLAICESLGLSIDDFHDIIDETFDDIGLRRFAC